MLVFLGYLGVFALGVCVGVLIVGLMAANDELERKGRHDE